MGEKYIPHEREEKKLVKIVTGYNASGKPTTETRFVNEKEFQELQEKNISFEIITKDKDIKDGGEIDETM